MLSINAYYLPPQSKKPYLKTKMYFGDCHKFEKMSHQKSIDLYLCRNKENLQNLVQYSLLYLRPNHLSSYNYTPLQIDVYKQIQ